MTTLDRPTIRLFVASIFQNCYVSFPRNASHFCPDHPVNPSPHIAFRLTTLFIAVLLLIQCVWLLLAEFSRPGIDRLPTDVSAADVAAQKRDAAIWAASSRRYSRRSVGGQCLHLHEFDIGREARQLDRRHYAGLGTRTCNFGTCCRSCTDPIWRLVTARRAGSSLSIPAGSPPRKL